ncbi:MULTISPECIES: hypothetical protein [unclassified Amycolatopsis]|uniref:hypothetical protein n=1 Tax=unclassified Amycolatopsis TaxID=2618356 RepID=UPI0028752EE1|nr:MULTISPECIES: hypothetical protein [unclassified Amycolatopsis]MDS0139686.1 sigma-70 family RNA polymerase sigma factor [Amycolatopsis sp. 505]MDS0145109.1 sigma-70 family RNA polymerase sigma factor [Amycolatopsis sp. CM201R]
MEGWSLSEDLPDRKLSLVELVELARSTTTTSDAKAAIWAEAVRRTQTEPRLWLPVAVAMMAPELSFMTRQFVDENGADSEDVLGDLFLGFLEALRGADPDMRRLLTHLKRVTRARATQPSVGRVAGYGAIPAVRAVPLSSPAGHVDLVLADAVEHHFLTRAEAELIARTHFEKLALSVVARELGFPPGQAAAARYHAERKLIEFIHRVGTWSVHR